jgi:hypothetical protein
MHAKRDRGNKKMKARPGRRMPAMQRVGAFSLRDVSAGGRTAVSGQRRAARLTRRRRAVRHIGSSRTHANVAELADALDSGSSEVTLVRVQVPPFAQRGGSKYRRM